jgi:predicted Zn-dependent protease
MTSYLESLLDIKRWVTTWRTPPVLDWIRAASHYKAGRYDQAVFLYERGLSKRRNHAAEHCARMDLAFCLLHQGKLIEAEAHLKRVSIQMPHSREVNIRLARLQLWMGRSLDAVWTLRRATRTVRADGEIVGLLLYALLDNGGPGFLIQEVLQLCADLDAHNRQHPLLRAAQARLVYARSSQRNARKCLEHLAEGDNQFVEIKLLLAKLLLDEGKISAARRTLRRAMQDNARHPTVLSLLAQTYLVEGYFCNPDYAEQLALSACQASGWLSPLALHLLAEAYSYNGDRIAALMIAHRAKQEGSRLLGAYHDVTRLERLIDDLTQESYV